MLDSQVAIATLNEQEGKEPPRNRKARDWTEETPYCYVYELLHGGFPLYDREQTFLTTLARRWADNTPWLSPKQHNWLMEIARKHGIGV